MNLHLWFKYYFRNIDYIGLTKQQPILYVLLFYFQNFCMSRCKHFFTLQDIILFSYGNVVNSYFCLTLSILQDRIPVSLFW